MDTRAQTLSRPDVALPVLGVMLAGAAAYWGDWREVLPGLLVNWSASTLALWAVLRYGRQVVDRLDADRIRDMYPGQRDAALGGLLLAPLLQLHARLSFTLHATTNGAAGSLESLRARAQSLMVSAATLEETRGQVGRIREGLMGTFVHLASPDSEEFWRSRADSLMRHFDRYAPVLDRHEREALHGLARRLAILAKSARNVRELKAADDVWHRSFNSYMSDLIRVTDELERLTKLSGAHNQPPQ